MKVASTVFTPSVPAPALQGDCDRAFVRAWELALESERLARHCEPLPEPEDDSPGMRMWRRVPPHDRLRIIRGRSTRRDQ